MLGTLQWQISEVPSSPWWSHKWLKAQLQNLNLRDRVDWICSWDHPPPDWGKVLSATCPLVTQLCRLFATFWTVALQTSLLLHYLQDFAQTRAHWIHDAIQPPHPLPSPSPPAFSLSQRQGLFRVSSHQRAKGLELQPLGGTNYMEKKGLNFGGSVHCPEMNVI